MDSNIFVFHPYLGKIPILTNIFQLGWNHQLDKCSKHLVRSKRFLNQKELDNNIGEANFKSFHDLDGSYTPEN